MDKQACREWAKERLSKEKEQSHYLKSKKTLANLDELLTQLDAKNILTFIPMGFEPKVLDIVKTGKNKRRFFVPFMQDVSFKMVPYRLPLKKKRFNIYEAPYSSYALTKIDTAIDTIANTRGKFGSAENRIEYRMNVLTNVQIASTTRLSKIEDADFALETAKFTKSQIISKAASSMLAQANASSDVLLRLVN